MLDLTTYTNGHKKELEELLRSAQWQQVIKSDLIEEVKAQRIEPGNIRDFIDAVVNPLLDFNKEKVNNLIKSGCRDKDYLLSVLSRWPDRLAEKDPKLSFLGLNITSRCNVEPACLYCNQPQIEPSLDLSTWKKIINEVASNNNGEGPYVYITGGEPLTLGENLWGDNGLVKFAAQRGAGVNVNTNAMMLTPEIALRFIKAGLSKLHISLDTSIEDVQNYLFNGDYYDQVLEGIYNVQLARDLIGVSYPVVHINCVLTNRNLDLFPSLFAFILEKHKQTVDKDDPFYNDLFPHIIPVGGSSNDFLRPTEAEFRKFYEVIWPEITRIWDKYQEKYNIPEDKREVLFGYFSNPFLRVRHKGGLDAYVKASAEGLYGKLALPKYCYVAPTQASFTPDGYQYRCGFHAIRRLLPVGHIEKRNVFENIRVGLSDHDTLPQEEYCYGCALATLYINQYTEIRLKGTLKSMLER